MKNLKIFDEIKDKFYKEGIISIEQYYENNRLESLFDIYFYFKNIGVEENLIKKSIAKAVGIKIFNLPSTENLKNEDFLFVENGVYHKGIYYLQNPFYRNNIKLTEELISLGIIKEVGLISDELFSKIKQKINNNDFINFFIEQKVIHSIKNGFSKFSIYENGDVFYSYFNKKILEKNNSVFFDFNKITIEKESYSLKINKTFYDIKILKTTKEITVNLNKNSIILFEKLEPLYKDEIFDYLNYKNGLILLSSSIDESTLLINSLYSETKEKQLNKTVNIISKEMFNNNEEDLQIIMNNSDIIFIENFDNFKYQHLIKEQLLIGKLIILDLKAQNSVSSVYRILNLKNFDKKIIATNLLCSYYYTSMPKLCNSCKKEIDIDEYDIEYDPYYFELMHNSSQNNKYFHTGNYDKCSCINGYKDGIIVSEFFNIKNNEDKEFFKIIEGDFSINNVKIKNKSMSVINCRGNAFKLALNGLVSVFDVKELID